MRVQRTLILPALAACALLLGSACSSDGSDASPSTTSARSTTTAEGSTTTEPGDDTTTTTEGDDGPTTTTGGDEPAGDAEAYVAALEKTLTDPALEGIIDADQARCVAEGFVGAIGEDRLVESGVSPEDFATKTAAGGNEGLKIDEATANDMYDAYGECDVDLKGLFETQTATELTAEEKACIDDLLTEENLRESFVISVTGGDLEDDPTADILTCVDLPEISSVPTTAAG